jgi:hypothetical protein
LLSLLQVQQSVAALQAHVDQADKLAREVAAHTAASSSGMIKLNVGGHKYHTCLSSLTAVPDTFFTALLSQADWVKSKTSEDELFIDRDGEVRDQAYSWTSG